MNDIIHLLPDKVANQIAAGEVIQRPASVIKELVENAVDAGATEIEIIVRDAGKTLIQVIDNGKGMSETDARLAFERHATSKISSAEDLFELTTMGFRGEALPSICAISHVELQTKRDEDKLGTKLLIQESKVKSQEHCICPRGANFMVKNLFCNTPARRKFMKSDHVETGHIMREFERLALVNNNLRMKIDTGSKSLDLPPAPFKKRITDLWKSIDKGLLKIDVDTSIVKIDGFISDPTNSRRKGWQQFLIVNGRNMRHPRFHKAIVSCFEGLMTHDAQPNYFIKLEVDPHNIDVNIHPTKNEIKFEDETAIMQILTAAVKAALGQSSSSPQIDFSQMKIPIVPIREGETVEAPPSVTDPTYNPFTASERPSTSHAGGGNYRPQRIDRGWEELYESFKKTAPQQEIDAPELPEITKQDVAPICVQMADKYIVTPHREGLMIIDQHRAHLKVMYERIMNNARSSKPAVQGMIFPEYIELDNEQQLALESAEDDLKRMGFNIEYEEENRWILKGTPANLEIGNPKEMVLRMLMSVSEDVESTESLGEIETDMLSRLALTMARSAAIKGGQRLGALEMEHLISELFSLPAPALTPYGAPVFKIIATDNIESLFLK